MAKIKVHELAKELGISSKDVINVLQEKGIEAKAAQSSIEEDAVKIVKDAFGKGSNTANMQETNKEEVKQEVKAQEAAPAPKAEDGAETPKKKKKIIFVSNPQNSKMPGQRSNQQGNANNYGNNQGRQGANNNRQQAPARGPIKPLTPPSPTPSVQMVPSKPAQPKAQPVKEQETVQVAKTENTATQAPVQPQSAAPVQERPAKENRPQGDRPYNRDGQRPQGDRPYNRDGQRPQGDRPYNRDGQKPQGDRPFNRDGQRPQGDRPYNRDGQRPQGDRPYNRDGQRPQGDRPFNRDGQRPQGGGFNKDGFNKDGRGFGGKDGDDNRRGFGGKGQGGFRDKQQGAKSSFGGDAAPAKDLEKKREEEKRRFSQEKDNKRSKKDSIYEEDDALKNKPGRFIKPEKKKEVVEETIKVITLPETITIKDLADKMKLQPSAIVKKLFLEGKIVTVNQEISYEDAENIAMEYDILCEKEVKVDVIEELLKEEEEPEENLVERPPVICVMGHVDHGKTSLLDAIRKTNVTDKEAGGITQHIGAYTVNAGGRTITFLDTPGHEAFTAMRMRGANATDIAILVVAADDGVMPQTVEAINHAKAAGIEIIVAVNKIDKPSANIDRVKQELSEYELIPEDWGGSTVFAPVSAKTGEGIEQLLEMILLSADILELKANPKRRARGLVIEAELDKGRGPVATVLVQKGTLHVGDFISAGAAFGKVRAMVDDKGRRVKEATPSTPVEILGLSDVPSAGEVFLSHDSDKTAKNYAETYMAQNKERKLEETKTKMSLDDLFSQIKEGNLKELNLIVKADVQGSVEAVKQSLMKLSNEEVVVKCIHGGVGAINESDVVLASASNAIIIGFNVRPDATAKATAEREGVDVRLYKVIYQAIEDVEAAMKGMLDPVFEEKVIGHAEVRQIFKASAIGNIAGSYVLDGVFQRGCKVRISREGTQIFEGELASLKRFKDDVKEVKTGFECGLVFDGFDQMQELDIVEAYIMVEVPR
ncbi:MAG: translation initiation factor IF-2 [Lachnospiraceae bacterium]|nr:translation initiation factor IF-2 [Lachnospiraceae bacterium]